MVATPPFRSQTLTHLPRPTNLVNLLVKDDPGWSRPNAVMLSRYSASAE